VATRYRNNIARVMANYPPGSSALLIAMDALIETVITQTEGRSADQLAQASCLGTLHTGAPKGVMCKACFDAMESGRAPQDDPNEGPIVIPKEQKAQEDEIARQVKMMMGLPDDDE
jgi:hypothetical protein